MYILADMIKNFNKIKIYRNIRRLFFNIKMIIVNVNFFYLISLYVKCFFGRYKMK